MNPRIYLVAIMFFAFISTGCAVGNTYDYTAAQVNFPNNLADEIGVGVIEKRPYVLSGDKPSSFIGLQRGGFGNPFDVSTKSGNPLTQDIANALSASLERAGVEVTIIDAPTVYSGGVSDLVALLGAKKNIILEVKEWKTDVMMRVGLSYDLTLYVTDKQGVVLAKKSISGEKEVVGAGGMEGSNSKLSLRALEEKMMLLMSSTNIVNALRS